VLPVRHALQMHGVSHRGVCVHTTMPPLRYWLFTPELQWQSRGKRRISQGWRGVPEPPHDFYGGCVYLRSPIPYRGGGYIVIHQPPLTDQMSRAYVHSAYLTGRAVPTPTAATAAGAKRDSNC
jgi:hypothetical protein